MIKNKNALWISLGFVGCALLSVGASVGISQAINKNKFVTPTETVSSVTPTEETPAMMGIRFDVGKDPVRLGAAEGKVAGINGAVNDFDYLPVYKAITTYKNTAGDVVWKCPTFYEAHLLRYSYATDGTATFKGEDWLISASKVNSDYHIPAAFLDKDGKDRGYFTLGAYKASLNDAGDKLQSIPGKYAAVSKSIEQFRTLSTAAGGHIAEKRKMDAVNVLMMIEFGKKNLASVFQGFAGSNIYSDTTYSKEIQNNIIQNGLTDTLKGSSHELTTMENKYLTVGNRPFSYRGLENPWGGVYEWRDGAVVRTVSSKTASKQKSTLAICLDPTKYSEATTATQVSTDYVDAYTLKSGSWAQTSRFQKDSDLFPGVLAADDFSGSDKYANGCDMMYQAPETLTTDTDTIKITFLYSGAGWDSGSGNGAFYWYGNSSSTDADADVGCRLTFDA